MLVLGWFFKPKVVFDSAETKLQCMSPELLVLGWFFKPKVVLDSPETELQCMSPELNKNLLNGFAKGEFESRLFLNSCVRAKKRGEFSRMLSNTKPSLL